MTTKTVLITCADRYMGPVIKRRFESEGHRVVCGASPMTTEAEVEALVTAAGDIDIVIANLAQPPMSAPVQNIANADWQALFDALVHPLMYLVRAVTPAMLARQSGKIIAVTSAAPVRGIPNNAAYCAARGAQNSFLKAVGLELARSNIQVNAVGQNYVNNDTYYPDDLLDNPKFLDHVRRNVPTNRIGKAEETAELVAYLASDNCTHIVGALIPLAGGWIT
jgi:2-keto-3-deoxy-L-fuconate dehydrogenase